MVCSQHTASQVQMLRGIAREGKMVLRAHMVRIGDTKMRAKTKKTKRMIEDVFIVPIIGESS